MDQFEKYNVYAAKDFATDLDFITWVKCADSESDKFWKEFLSQHPYQADNVDKARKIVNAMNVVSHSMGEEETVHTWHSIQNRISESYVVEKKPVIYMRPWLVAASIALVLTTGYFLFFKKPAVQKVAVKTEKKQPANEDLLPGGNKAVLTLADGSTIVLDSAQNGSLATQGGSDIVKLADGRIVYRNNKDAKIANQMNTVATPRGGQYQLSLSDGTKVWLNAESSIHYPATFSGAERNISMAGEAYFEVAHNAKMPFHVSVNGVVIEVLGTHFNVNAYRDHHDIRATLFQGKVKVESGGTQAMLIPGQEALVSDQTNKISVKEDVDPEEVLAWKNGKFYFNNVDIRSVMNQVSRWYDVDVVYEGKVNKVFGGTISRDVSASDIFKILEATGGVHFKIEGRKVIVSP